MLGYKGHYKVTTLHWAAFRNATRHWVQEKPNGLLYFRHQSLRSAVEKKLLGKARICADTCWLRGGSLRHDTFGFGWSPESHQSEENPFLAAVTFFGQCQSLLREIERTRGRRCWPQAVEKTRWKTQSNVEIWNGPEKEAVKNKKDYSSKTLPLGKMDGAVKLSRQRILSAK
ncbi:hypothetical protein Celaphus_00011808, partial [Cervus elaphus hippelaphus]